MSTVDSCSTAAVAAAAASNARPGFCSIIMYYY